MIAAHSRTVLIFILNFLLDGTVPRARASGYAKSELLLWHAALLLVDEK